MNGDDRKRRTVAAQGFAALALFLFAHAAHAAALPAQTQPAGLGHSAALSQPRPE